MHSTLDEKGGGLSHLQLAIGSPPLAVSVVQMLDIYPAVRQFDSKLYTSMKTLQVQREWQNAQNEDEPTVLISDLDWPHIMAPFLPIPPMSLFPGARDRTRKTRFQLELTPVNLDRSEINQLINS